MHARCHCCACVCVCNQYTTCAQAAQSASTGRVVCCFRYTRMNMHMYTASRGKKKKQSPYALNAFSSCVCACVCTLFAFCFRNFYEWTQVKNMLRRLPLPLPLMLLLLFVLLHMYACACAWRILAELRSLCWAACAGMCVLFPKHSTSCCVDCTATVMFCCLTTVALRLLFLPFLFFICHSQLAVYYLLPAVGVAAGRVCQRMHSHTHTHRPIDKLVSGSSCCTVAVDLT